MEEDGGSTATMTSVTEDLSQDETDTSTHDMDTSSEITSSDAVEERNTAVNTPLPTVAVKKEEADIHEFSREGLSELDETVTSTDNEKSIPHASISAQLKSSHRLPWGSGVRMHYGTQQKSSHCRAWESGIHIPDVNTMQGEWYNHKCFNHYWSHYHYVSIWCRKHMETYRTVIDQYNRMIRQQTLARQTMASQQEEHVFKKPVNKKTLRNRKARRRRKTAKKQHRMEQKMAKSELPGSSSLLTELSDQTTEEGAQRETTESVLEGGEMNADAEITDELLDFFAHTHKHRQERDALKESKGSEKEQKHRNIEDGDEDMRTETAPVERPGSKRMSEMQLLYGKGAAMIHGMETALQMTFDRNTDILQPRMWPNMPLKIIF